MPISSGALGTCKSYWKPPDDKEQEIPDWKNTLRKPEIIVKKQDHAFKTTALVAMAASQSPRLRAKRRARSEESSNRRRSKDRKDSRDYSWSRSLERSLPSEKSVEISDSGEESPPVSPRRRRKKKRDKRHSLKDNENGYDVKEKDIKDIARDRSFEKTRNEEPQNSQQKVRKDSVVVPPNPDETEKRDRPRVRKLSEGAKEETIQKVREKREMDTFDDKKETAPSRDDANDQKTPKQLKKTTSFDESCKSSEKPKTNESIKTRKVTPYHATVRQVDKELDEPTDRRRKISLEVPRKSVVDKATYPSTPPNTPKVVITNEKGQDRTRSDSSIKLKNKRKSRLPVICICQNEVEFEGTVEKDVIANEKEIKGASVEQKGRAKSPSDDEKRLEETVFIGDDCSTRGRACSYLLLLFALLVIACLIVFLVACGTKRTLPFTRFQCQDPVGIPRFFYPDLLGVFECCYDTSGNRTTDVLRRQQDVWAEGYLISSSECRQKGSCAAVVGPTKCASAEIFSFKFQAFILFITFCVYCLME